LQPYYQSINPVSLTGLQVDQILAMGWYRMHQSIFTTSHVSLGDLYRVRWLRYAIAEIKIHASHKRIKRNTKNFRFSIEDFIYRDEHRDLHLRYRASIDFDGAPSITDCLFGEEEVIPSIFDTKCVSVYDGEKLIACGYFDVGKVSATSILHFFDPEYKRYSLGKYLMLLTLDYLRDNNYRFYYPGYIVQGNPKMDYKLFIGKEQAQYFEPSTGDWKYFHEGLLGKQSSTNETLIL
jgi:leucyl-tRNA---protein transferase